MLNFTLIIFLAYLLGSISTSIWIGKFFYGIDIRNEGSKNAGSTNTFRVLGIKAGVPVLFIDILKGFLAVRLVYLTNFFVGTDSFFTFSIALGIAAVLGHIFPVYEKFKGGKGVATLLGVVLSIHPPAALLTICVFLIVLLISRYVSLSSIIAGLAFPILLIGVFKTTALPLIIFSLAIAILLLVTHQKNIERLLKSEESKANLFKKKKKRED